MSDDRAKTPRRPPAGGQHGGDRHSDQALIDALKRRAAVMRLRLSGADFDTIAAACGYADRSGAYRAWREGMRDIAGPVAQEAYDLELQRLDAALAAIWDKVLRGNLTALDRFLALTAARRKLMGLDAALKLDLDVDEAQQQVTQVVAELFTFLHASQVPPAS